MDFVRLLLSPQRARRSLPLNPNHLQLFGQKTIGDGGFEGLADGFFMLK
jgi:hypothetical protein